jgi:hypothetical protein
MLPAVNIRMFSTTIVSAVIVTMCLCISTVNIVIVAFVRLIINVIESVNASVDIALEIDTRPFACTDMHQIIQVSDHLCIMHTLNVCSL